MYIVLHSIQSQGKPVSTIFLALISPALMPFTKAFFIRSRIVELADASRRSLKKLKKSVDKKIQKGERSSKKIVIKIFKFLCFLLMLIRNKSCWETSLTIRERSSSSKTSCSFLHQIINVAQAGNLISFSEHIIAFFFGAQERKLPRWENRKFSWCC